MKRAAVILVNWKGTDDTLACLSSLRKLRLSGISLEIIVIDNASGGDAVERIARSYPEVTLLPQERNLGFAGGNNVGIRYAFQKKLDFIWLLNNDTEVAADALVGLVDMFTDPTVGIAGSKIYFYPGFEFHADRYTKKEIGHVIWHAGGQADWRNMYASHRGVDEVDCGQFDTPLPVPFVTGCSLMIRREVVGKIGVLPEEYFMYYEDFAYCMEAKNAGFSVWYTPKSVIWHKNAGSTARPGNDLHEYYLTRNRLVIGLRYAPVRTKAALLREAVRQLAVSTPIRKKAVRDALCGRMGNRFVWQGKSR